MSVFDIILLFVYGIALLMLAIFGLHKYFLLYLYKKHKKNPPANPSAPDRLPKVTVQLPNRGA
jgi:hypothetical protein